MPVRCALWLLLVAPTWALQADAELLFATPTLAGTLSARSWKSLRDERVVKQEFDFSCGAASLATVLQSFYGRKVAEGTLLEAMGKTDAASFDDMARVLPQFGFKAVGVAISFDQLSRLKIPAVVHLRLRDQEHFSVVRGVGKGLVWLADPSWGNRRLSQARFLAMWETREPESPKGRALLVLPSSVPASTKPDFFGKPGSFELPVEMLSLRLL